MINRIAGVCTVKGSPKDCVEGLEVGRWDTERDRREGERMLLTSEWEVIKVEGIHMYTEGRRKERVREGGREGEGERVRERETEGERGRGRDKER